MGQHFAAGSTFQVPCPSPSLGLRRPNLPHHSQRKRDDKAVRACEQFLCGARTNAAWDWSQAASARLKTKQVGGARAQFSVYRLPCRGMRPAPVHTIFSLTLE